MKYCVHCGRELDDLADYCPGCGVKCVDKTLSEQNQKINKEETKALRGKTVGILLGVFAGIIGLILVVLLGDEECKKYGIKAFVITICVSIGIALLVTIISLILVATGVLATASLLL